MNIIITAGGTIEKIDNVRKITNISSGRLGKKIAEQIINSDKNIDNIFYICTNKSERPDSGVVICEIEGVLELEFTIKELMSEHKIDFFIHSMAISDYRVDYVTNMDFIVDAAVRGFSNFGDLKEAISNPKKIDNSNKISSDEEDLVVVLKKTPKIISMIKKLQPDTFLVGFKLLDNVSRHHLLAVAHNLLVNNNCSLVLANDLSLIDEHNHVGLLLKRDGSYQEFGNKDDIAKGIAETIFSDKL